MTPLVSNIKSPKTPAWPAAGVCVLLVLAVLAVFGQTTRFGFVNFDDPIYVYHHAVEKNGLTQAGFVWAFTEHKIDYWHPLTWLSHMADWQVFGPWAGGHHLTNVLLHGTAAMLLFLALREMTGSLGRSAFVAAIFAIHPLRAESVAWVSERKDVLSGAFFMLTLWSYARYAARPSSGRYASVAAAFALGLMAKNTLITIPFVLLLLDWWPLRRINRNFASLILEKIPLLLMSIASCLTTALLPEDVTGAARLSGAERLANAVVSYVVYLRQMFFPGGLAIPHLFPRGEYPMWETGGAILLLAAISTGAFLWRKKRPYLLAGWLWYLGMLLPMIGAIQISYYSRADRYTYLPEIGLALAATWAVADWSAGWKHPTPGLRTASIGVIGALMVSAYIQTSYWRDSETLWGHTLARDPNNYIAHNCLGLALYEKGDKPGAMAEYHKALEAAPDYAEALYNLGNSLFEKGDKTDAIALYGKALESNPAYKEARENLAVALLSSGRNDEAIAQYRKVLAIDPENAKAEYNLGIALGGEGQLDNAIGCFRQGARMTGAPADVYVSLGLAYFEKGAVRDAIDSWQKALALKPDQPSVQNNLAWLLATTPEASLRDGAKALALAQKANESNRGGNPAVLHTLAAAYAETGRFGDATATARQAMELAAAQKNDDLAAKLPREIKLYEADQPMRDAPP